jgi:predicted transcriptional regulator
MLDASARSFALAEQLAWEAREPIDALVRGAGLDRQSERLFRRHLTGYFAASVMMPYARFLRACEATGYDLDVLQRRFGASFSQVAHRLTTLQRVGARGLPFFMLRVDRAGQVSKRYAGASGSPLAEGPGVCPLWDVFAAFARADVTVSDLVETEDARRWFTLARCVTPQGAGQVQARFAVALGLDAAEAGTLAAARGMDLRRRATPVGLGCRACTRVDCPQRSAPPAGRALVMGERESGVTPLGFAVD